MIIDLSHAKGPLIARWINIDTGEWDHRKNFRGKGKIPLTPPNDSNRIAAINTYVGPYVGKKQLTPGLNRWLPKRTINETFFPNFLG